MAGLSGLLPKNTYGDLLQAGNSGAGVPSSLQQISDGLGNLTGLRLSTTQGWMQNAFSAALASGFTDATGTLAATALSVTLLAGRSYAIQGCFQVSNSLAADGFQCSFNGGTATATTFFMSAAVVGSVVAGTVVSTTLAGVINWTTTTATDYILLSGYLKVNAGGTFIVKAASNTHVSGTMTLGAGSWISLTDVPAL
jgi:hypothetical protein